MSVSARFNRLIKDAYQNEDINAALQAYNEFQDTQCLYPRLQEVVDSHTQQKIKIVLNCGRCFHCIQTKINEWTTRMYAHAEDFKNVYFVTLTYRSITNIDLQLNQLIMQRLNGALWHFDSKNSTHHLSWNPCVLCKDHYQKFLKRLRKNTGLKDITYVISGEYGHDYGRPHFHLILFTNGTLTKADIVRAWSVCLWRRNNGFFVQRTNQKNNGVAFDFPIGRVDFHDLVSNGTFNTTAKIRVDGTYMNAANCFSYVAKYVVKRENANLSRVNLAYDSMYKKRTFVKLFENEVSFSIAKEYLMNVGYNNIQADELVSNKLKQLSYEKTIFDPVKSLFVDGLCRFRAHEKNGFEWSDDLFPSVHYEFCNSFRPFCEFSRGTPIGSVYAKRNIQEFAQGVFTKPLLQDSSYVVPSYFRIKAKDYLYGLRKVRCTLSCNTFVLSGLVDLQRRFEDSLANNLPLVETIHDTDDYQIIKAALQSDFNAFADKYTGERIILYNGFAQHYKFLRRDKSYHLTRAIPVADWIRFWCKSLQDEMIRHHNNRNLAKENLRNSESGKLILTDLGFVTSTLAENYKHRQEQLLKENQKLYHSSHLSVE